MMKQTVLQKAKRSLDQFQQEFLKYLCCGLQSTYSVTDVKPLVSGNCLQIDWKDGHTSTYEYVRNGLIQCTIISNFPHQRPSADNARRYEKKSQGPGVFHGFRHIYFLGKENAIFKLRYVLSCNVSGSLWYTLSLLSSAVHAMDTTFQTVAYKRLKPKNGNRPFQLVCLNLFYHFRPRDGTAKNFSFKFCPIHGHTRVSMCI